MTTLPAVEVVALVIVVVIALIALAFYLIRGENKIEERAKRYFHRNNKPLKE